MRLTASLSRTALFRPVSITPLVSFRIAFGLLMFLSSLRFWWRGWVTAVYVLPKFHFSYFGFSWVQPLPGIGMHLIFGLMALSALCMALGLFYRWTSVLFFLSFTYIELIDLTTYLNHYYFISLVAFLMIWLPANRHYALDATWRPAIRCREVPAWTIGILRFQMGIVYFFAGLAKLNPDWMLEAIPLKIWLPAKSHLPLIGPLLYQSWLAYVFSWFGALYDLLIPFFLINPKTRNIAYLFVLIFHGATALFFPGIGMFPYIMIVCSTIFFSAAFHERILSRLPFYRERSGTVFQYRGIPVWQAAIWIYIAIQLLAPMRFVLYPGHLFWNEEGYRFSWRVMLMEKSGATYFKVRDADGRQAEVNNAEFLTPLQEKMMSTQPDMILQYAHFLAREYNKRGFKEPKVFAEVYVALNGTRSRLFIDSNVNLAAEPISIRHYPWVLPYHPKKTEP